MGDEIDKRYFSAEDFSRFRARLDQETALLKSMFDGGQCSRNGNIAGFELEASLIDADGRPLPKNVDYLARLNNPLVVSELAMFNVELNGSPTALTGHAFSRLYDELQATWRACVDTARIMQAHLLIVGIVPTLRQSMLQVANMTPLLRYQSLNDRIIALRDGRPVQVDINGDAPLTITHPDVMLEAAATSFQIHLQCYRDNSVRDFNAAIAISAPMVAVSANSPFLFGHALWDETRIPLFEQSVHLGERYPGRVGFGSGYARESLMELFDENRFDHPILLPAIQEDPINTLVHLRFHNGTLWRWNRPLVGFDYDGLPHLRIEHRVVPAGPTIKDCIANSAFFFGLVRGLALQPEAVENHLSFARARANFYEAAQYGLNAMIYWPDVADAPLSARALVAEHLLPLARIGLQSCDIPDSEIDTYLGIIAARVENGQNGAVWQRAWVERNGLDMQGLVQIYHTLQESGDPVHLWSV